MNVPAIASQWLVRKMSPHGYWFSSEETVRLIRGPLYEKIIPLLDGKKSVRDLEADLQGEVTTSAIRRAIAELVKQGILVEGADEQPRADAYWRLAGLGPLRTGHQSVEVLVTEQGYGDGLLRALGAVGIPASGPAAL